jgi:hypothetical protein
MPTDQGNKEGAEQAQHLMVISGIAVLLWSGLEDHDAVLVTALGAFMAAAATMMLLNSQRFGARVAKDNLPKRAALVGALIGMLASVTTALLMLFKDLRHAHVFPDYPPGMMLATLERMPIWALAGGLAGFGLGILIRLGVDWQRSR